MSNEETRSLKNDENGYAVPNDAEEDPEAALLEVAIIRSNAAFALLEAL